MSWQKHTANRAEVKREHKGRGATKKETSLMDVDALFTHEPNVLIGVFTADCVGILLCDEQTPCVCAIHSGWKGTAQAITYHTVKALAENGDLVPARTKAFFSPSILFDSLEVGMEVVEQIEAMGREIDLDVEPFIRRVNGGKAYIDNQGLNIEMLRRLGVRDIVPTGLDTKKSPPTASRIATTSNAANTLRMDSSKRKRTKRFFFRDRKNSHRQAGSESARPAFS